MTIVIFLSVCSQWRNEATLTYYITRSMSNLSKTVVHSMCGCEKDTDSRTNHISIALSLWKQRSLSARKMI